MSNKKTFKREATQTIILGRAGERIVINPGQVFEFTEEELASNQHCVSEKSVMSLDDPEGDVDLKKVESKRKPNQTNAPNAKGKSEKENDEDM